MKPSQLVSISLLALLATTPAWAVYKCKDASGRITFQQAPCQGAHREDMLNVQPASGPTLRPQEPAPAATPATISPEGSRAAPLPMTEAGRLNALAARLAKENRLATLNNLAIGGAQGEVLQSQEQCRAELEAVRKRKANASNDLAGATWEQSLSTEMQAIAARCDTEQRRLQSNLDRLLSEKQDLERALAQP